MKEKKILTIISVVAGLTLALIWLMGGMGTAVHAATFAVNSTIDAVDANPGDGICATVGGVCTLRAAIQEANALAGDDTITLPAGTYTLSIAGTEEDDAATGDLDITEALILNGNSASNTIIDGNALDRVFQVFTDTNLSGVTIQNGLGYDPQIFNCGGGGIRHNYGNLIIADSLITNNNTTQNGGAICNFTLGELTILNSVVDGNSAGGFGGGIQIDLPSNLNIVNSTISNNSAWKGGGITFASNDGTKVLNIDNSQIISNTASQDGGGIYLGGGALDISQGALSYNTADGSGGGLYLFADEDQAIINGTTVANNTSQWGGALYISSDNTEVGISDVTFANNMATSGGGAIYYGYAENTTLSITGSTFNDNYLPVTASSGGGALRLTGDRMTLRVSDSRFERNISPVYSGGGIALSSLAYQTTVAITNTAFISNSTGGSGGGMALSGNYGSGTVHNSIFDNNSSLYSGGAISQWEFALTMTQSSLTNNSGSWGGAVYYNSSSTEDVSGSSLTTINTTFSGNSATEFGGAVSGNGSLTDWTANNTTFANNIADSDNNGIGDGGGFALANGAFVLLSNNIIAKNIDRSGEAPDCFSESFADSIGFNLVGESDGCNLTTNSSDLVGTAVSPLDPRLDTLTGSPAYYPLLETSPAIDAGNPAIPGSGFPACAATDQRGVLRPFDGDGDSTAVCDIGAYEWADLSYVYLPLVVK
jgi:CSLREA domain-containing protein